MTLVYSGWQRRPKLKIFQQVNEEMADLLDDSSVASNDAQEKIKVLALIFLYSGEWVGGWWMGLFIYGIVFRVCLFVVWFIGLC